MRLALKIAIIRARKTQREIGLRLRIPEGRMSDIVRGKVNPTDGEATALAEELEQSASVLFGDQEHVA